jgi:hypothetical protein
MTRVFSSSCNDRHCCRSIDICHLFDLCLLSLLIVLVDALDLSVTCLQDRHTKSSKTIYLRIDPSTST